MTYISQLISGSGGVESAVGDHESSVINQVADRRLVTERRSAGSGLYPRQLLHQSCVVNRDTHHCAVKERT